MRESVAEGPGRPRLAQLDLLRGAAILGVVAIHATSPFLGEMAAAGAEGTPAFRLLLAFNQLGRYSVPGFFLMAGLLAAVVWGDRCGRPGGTRLFLRRRLARILLPYLTWSAVFFLAPLWLRGGAGAAGVIRRLLLGETFAGGYFLVALAQLTLLAPALLRFGAGHRRAAWGACAGLLATTEVLYCAGAYGSGDLAGGLRAGFSASLSFFYVWAAFFFGGILIGLDRERILGRLGGARTAAGILAAVCFAASLWESARVHRATGSLGLAA
ncbi:MAG: acyltransferase family protein, partial [Acidobacteriota bacterium]